MRNILLVLIILLLVGALPSWPYSMHWGYAPSGVFSVIFIILIILAVTGRL